MQKPTKLDFTKNEMRDIIISVAAVTFIFAYPDFGLIPFFFVAVVIAFLLHEMAHRFVARKFGCIAIYKMWPQGLILGFLASLIGFKFVAPGAVMIFPFQFARWGFKRIELSMTEMGIISISGIAVNLFFAAIFSPFAGTLMMGGIDVFSSLSFVNAFLALFNLLPIPPLDGSKVFKWKPWLWAVVTFFAILLILPSFISI